MSASSTQDGGYTLSNVTVDVQSVQMVTVQHNVQSEAYSLPSQRDKVAIQEPTMKDPPWSHQLVLSAAQLAISRLDSSLLTCLRKHIIF